MVNLRHLISSLGELNEFLHFPVHVLQSAWDLVSTWSMLAAVIVSGRGNSGLPSEGMRLLGKRSQGGARRKRELSEQGETW